MVFIFKHLLAAPVELRLFASEVPGVEEQHSTPRSGGGAPKTSAHSH